MLITLQPCSLVDSSPKPVPSGTQSTRSSSPFGLHPFMRSNRSGCPPRRSALPPLQLLSEDVVVGAGLGAHQTEPTIATLDRDDVERLARMARLTVEGHEHLVVLLHH